MQVDRSMIHDRGRIAEHAGAGDGPGTTRLIVEGCGGNRDVAIDVAGIVDRDGAAGLDDRIGRRGHRARVVGPDRAGIVDRHRAGRIPLNVDRRVTGRRRNRPGIGDVRRAGRARRVLRDADAGEARAADVTVIDDGDVAGASGEGSHADRTSSGAIIGDGDVAAAVIECADRDACGVDVRSLAGRDRDVADAPGERLDAIAGSRVDRRVAGDDDVAIHRVREGAVPAGLVAGDDRARRGAVVVERGAGMDRAMRLDGDRAPHAGSNRRGVIDSDDAGAAGGDVVTGRHGNGDVAGIEAEGPDAVARRTRNRDVFAERDRHVAGAATQCRGVDADTLRARHRDRGLGEAVHRDVAIPVIEGVDAVTGRSGDVGMVVDDHRAVDTGIGVCAGGGAGVAGLDAGRGIAGQVRAAAGIDRAVGGDRDATLGRCVDRRRTIDGDDARAARSNDAAGLGRDGLAAAAIAPRPDAVDGAAGDCAASVDLDVAVAQRHRVDAIRAAYGTAELVDRDVATIGGVQILDENTDRIRAGARRLASEIVDGDVAGAGRTVAQRDSVAGVSRDVLGRRQRDVTCAVLGGDEPVGRACQSAGGRQNNVGAIAAGPARCGEVERIAQRRIDVSITGDGEGTAGRSLSRDGAGEVMARIIELERIDAAGEGDRLRIRAA